MLGNLHIWHLLRPAMYPFLFMITQLTQACKKKYLTCGRPPLQIKVLHGQPGYSPNLKSFSFAFIKQGKLVALVGKCRARMMLKKCSQGCKCLYFQEEAPVFSKHSCPVPSLGKYRITKSTWAIFLRYCVAPCSLKRRRRLGLDSEGLKCM